MKKEVILKEMDRLIFEEKSSVSFRKLGSSLNIAPATISYQFHNQDNLYKEYLKYKLKSIISLTAIQSFENLMLALGQLLYELFECLSNDITFDMVDALIGSAAISNFAILDSLFEKDYEEANTEKEIAIVSNIIMAMTFPKNYSKIVNVDLSSASNREKLIKRIINREVKL